MSLNVVEKNVVSEGAQLAKKIINDIKPVLDRLNIVYDSDGGAKTTIDQTGLDEIAAFSNITKGQLDAGMYALTATLKAAVDSAYSALTILAARGN